MWRSGRVVDYNPKGRWIESRWCCFWWFIWRKVVGKLLRGRTKNRREIPMISKYSVFFVRTRRINAIFILKKFSVPLTSESVTSGQAGGVFRQLFLQCVQYEKKSAKIILSVICIFASSPKVLWVQRSTNMCSTVLQWGGYHSDSSSYTVISAFRSPTVISVTQKFGTVIFVLLIFKNGCFI